MKLKTKKEKYQLVSGDEVVFTATSIQSLCNHIGCQFSWVYYNKSKDTNKDGTWSFNYKNYNYTIKTI